MGAAAAMRIKVSPADLLGNRHVERFPSYWDFVCDEPSILFLGVLCVRFFGSLMEDSRFKLGEQLGVGGQYT